ncbi:hypothetical protein PBI_VALIDUS_28 [Mycobacterium phage Validus]|uniref:Glycine-rich domain-containing protein n=1 Tax=Mycobacterium phage Validus TaxID=1414747 RepID=V5UQR6_9CAUD|nr:minor tail protein [Mycobacterium phage Validus]AHB79558.1 hypothetical protein PBI_VALIDUS_28 [Mycobacterium phage Validus]
MSVWSPQPVDGGRAGVGWSTAPPASAPPIFEAPSWRPLVHELASALSVSAATAALAVRATAEALGVSASEAAVLLRASAVASSSSSARAGVLEHWYGGAAAASVSAAGARLLIGLVAEALDVSTATAATLLRSSAASRSVSAARASNSYPTTEPLRQEFITPGAFTFTIPYWCEYIDVVLLGGGEAGTNGSFAGNGQGGRAGLWFTVTLRRGVDIPWTATTITGVVGAGGASNGANGGATTATVAGLTSTAAGGDGGMGLLNPSGQGAGNMDYNGELYVGGASQTSLNGAGREPGGGGAGGGFLSSGGRGGRGQAWIRAYQ